MGQAASADTGGALIRACGAGELSSVNAVSHDLIEALREGGTRRAATRVG